MIKANDPQLHRISIAYEAFVIPKGIPILEGAPLTQPLFLGIPSVGASLSQPIPKEEEEQGEKENEEDPEGIVTLLDSSDEFKVFNQPPSPEDTSANINLQQQAKVITSNEMGIQRKSQRSLRDLIESQPGKDAPRKST